MSAYERLLQNYATAAAQALPPFTQALATALGVVDNDKIGLIGDALARAYMAGVNAGEAEVMAQVAEQGASITVKQMRAPDET